jgi:hypothetical protein
LQITSHRVTRRGPVTSGDLRSQDRRWLA